MVKLRKNSIWIVIPGYNEEQKVRRVLEKVLKITPNVIFVDDGSSDTTVQKARSVCTHVVTHPLNLGKGSALKTGCELAFHYLGAEAVIVMDSDDQHDPHELPFFIQKLQDGDALLFGVRALDRRMPLVRRWGSRVLSILLRVFFGMYIPDILCGFKAFSKHTYRKICWQSTDYSVELEIAARVAKQKLSYSTVPITTIYHDLDRGMTVLDMLSTLTQLVSWKVYL